MAQKAAVNVVKIRLPEYLQVWLSDCAERDFRTIEQQIVYLLAKCLDGHVPALGGGVANVGIANTDPVGAAGAVDVAVRYPLLDAPPAEVKTISIMGDASNAMGPSFGIAGKGNTYRVAEGLWDDTVAQQFFVVHGKRLVVYGQREGWLYLR